MSDAALGRAVRDSEVARILTEGELALDGRLVDSSNNALVGSVDGSLRCVYKPTAGERPLWDFPDGTLARREVAAYLVSRAAGWDCVPVTVYRDGPFGPGMVQEWIADADPDLAADLLAPDQVPESWLPVLAAQGPEGEPLVVAHADTPELATIAAFDMIANNADRKASHLLPSADGTVLGVDHGLTFHVEDKLRTILWGWAGRPLPGGVIRGLQRLESALAGELAGQLAELLADDEIAALTARVRAALSAGTFALPPEGRTAIPWPPL